MFSWTISWFDRNYIFSWLITVLIAGVIFYLSSQTFEGPPGGKSYLSIYYHFFAFFFLAFFFLISLIQGKINKPLLVIGIILAVLYGVSDEFHQFFVPGRSCCFEDILTNSAGILLAGALYSLHCVRCNNKIKPIKDKIVF